MCSTPLHIPKAIQSFALNMDMTARESGEGNLRTALNWGSLPWTDSTIHGIGRWPRKLTYRKAHYYFFFTYLNIWTDVPLLLNNPLSQNTKQKTSLTSILLSEALHPFFPVLPNFWRKWSILGLCSLRSSYCLIPPHLTSGSRLSNLLSNWSVIEKTIIELIPWVLTFPLSDLHK